MGCRFKPNNCHNSYIHYEIPCVDELVKQSAVLLCSLIQHISSFLHEDVATDVHASFFVVVLSDQKQLSAQSLQHPYTYHCVCVCVFFKLLLLFLPYPQNDQ